MTETGKEPADRWPPFAAPLVVVIALDIVLLFYAGWCLLPRAVCGEPCTLALPFGGRFRGTLTTKHLYQFWILLFIRQLIGASGGRPGLLARLASHLSPTFRAATLFAATLSIFLALPPNLAPVSGDSLGARLLPLSILREGNLDLDEFVPGLHKAHRYAVKNYSGHWYPQFPIFVGLTATPIYGALFLLLPDRSSKIASAYSTTDEELKDDAVHLFEQVAAAVIAALSVVVVWRFATVIGGAHGAMPLWIAAAYGFGTPILSSASRTLWMHGSSCLFLSATALALFVPTRRPETTHGLAGACLGWAYANRPSNGILIPLFLAWVFITHRRTAIYFTLGLGLMLAVVFAANAAIYGTIFGAYAAFAADFRSFDVAALATVLLSPSRGLFVFSPYLLIPVAFAVTGIRSCAMGRGRPAMSQIDRGGSGFPLLLLLGAAASAVLVACYGTWSGGFCFGPRLLSETALLLTLALPFQLDRFAGRPVARSIFFILVLFSCHVNVMGARFGDGGWTLQAFRGEQRLETFWDLRNSQLAWTLSR